MMRLGRNREGYLGETINPREQIRELAAAARNHGWRVDFLPAGPNLDLPAFSRQPSQESAWAPRIYVSAGIHGDEPAGPLALQRLIETDAFPANGWYWCCPLLNPTGFERNTRAAANGLDLNRDYLNPRSAEIRAHIDWLRRLPMFDLALCLHEDWEAAGFYVYELNPAEQRSLAPLMLTAVKEVCPIDLSATIDGREASEGLIRPALDPASRPEWPEAFFLIHNKTRLSYTLEAPSDYAMEVRVCALEAAVRAALQAFAESPGDTHRDDSTPPPP